MEADCRNALYTKVSSIASSLSLPVYYENSRSLDREAGNHLRASVNNLSAEQLTVCGTGAAHTWLLQINIYVRDGVGSIDPAGYADSICAELPVNTELSYNGKKFKVIDPGDVRPGIQSEGWFFIPVYFTFMRIN